MHNIHNQLVQKIEKNTVRLGILGLGYVGLPLAVLFAKKGVATIGFDYDPIKLSALKKGDNYIGDVEDADLQDVVENGSFEATDDFTRIKECDALLICVPTPLDKFKKPDMTYIVNACEAIGKNMKPGVFICLESTTYPTTTEKLMLPVLEKESGLRHGEDFWLAYSPERVDPGNRLYKTVNTPKVIGALTDQGLDVGLALYKRAIEKMYPVSSPRVAEMVKILENTYRLVNISLINELALLSGKMDIDIWEVIRAADTKPYGFQAFYPGPGIGGHCIPLDPFYLEYIAKNFDFDLTMIDSAGHINNLMPHRMTVKIASALNHHKKPINGSSILFLGAAYKPDISDERESPALKIMDEVDHKGGKISYYDPHIPTVTTEQGLALESIGFDPAAISTIDCVVIVTRHSSVDYEAVKDNAPLIVDLCNAYPEANEKIYKL